MQTFLPRRQEPFLLKMFNKITIIRLANFLNTNNSRSLARWVNRNPARLIPSEEYDEEKDTQIKKKSGLEWNDNYFQNKSLEDNSLSKVSVQNKAQFSRQERPLTISKKQQISKITIDMLETTMDEEGNFIYTKMKDNDTRISTILTEIKSKKDRDKKDLMVLEGKRLIKDALDANCKLQYLLFSRFQELEYLKTSIPKVGAKLYKMPYREIQMWSNLTTSPGLMGIFKIPDTDAYSPSKDSLPITVICDNIREADNLGAVLRTCSGVGCKEILLTKGCVNVWDSKVLRSACGAHFKLRIQNKLEWNTFNNFIPPNSKIFIADNKVISSNVVNENTDSRLLSDLINSIPIIPYYGVDFNQNRHNVLIIGGETEGISEESYKLVSEFNGSRVNIPLGNNTDSLNVGTALGVILFEIKRQYFTSKN